MLTLAAVIFSGGFGTNIAQAEKNHKKIVNPTWATLQQWANKEIQNGGARSREWGDASPKLKYISKLMIYRAFGSGYTGEKMLCYANRESGMNPWALSETGDHNLFQINYVAHHSYIDFNRLDKPDVGYGILAAKKLYNVAGYSPWSGGKYSC